MEERKTSMCGTRTEIILSQGARNGGKTMKRISKRVLAMVLGAVLLLGIAGIANTQVGQAKKKSKLIGTWKCEYKLDDTVLVAIYKFKKNGTGSYSLAGQAQKFTYRDNGKVVSIRFKNEDTDMKLKYKIKGKKFIFKDITGQKVVFIRQ